MGVGCYVPVGDGECSGGVGERDREVFDSVVWVDGDLAVDKADDIGFFVLFEKLGIADVEKALELCFRGVVNGEPVMALDWGETFAKVEDDGDIGELVFAPDFDGTGEALPELDFVERERFVIGFGDIPIDALGWNFVEAGSVFLDPSLEGEGSVTHCADRKEPGRFEFVGRSAERVATDVDFCLRAVDVSHMEDVVLVIRWRPEPRPVFLP